MNKGFALSFFVIMAGITITLSLGTLVMWRMMFLDTVTASIDRHVSRVTLRSCAERAMMHAQQVLLYVPGKEYRLGDRVCKIMSYEYVSNVYSVTIEIIANNHYARETFHFMKN